jgi:phosphinothricin acetyltransferase
MIRNATREDAEAIRAIYAHYVENSTVTFEEEVPLVEEMERRIGGMLAEFAWLVEEGEGEIRGYAYFGRWKPRSAYRESVESTVYVAKDRVGRGIGSGLYRALLERAREQGRHAVMAVLGLPNEESVRLHEKFGFEKVGHFREIGLKFGRRLDVGCWELIL